jgi:hypothetical protein
MLHGSLRMTRRSISPPLFICKLWLAEPRRIGECRFDTWNGSFSWPQTVY